MKKTDSEFSQNVHHLNQVADEGHRISEYKTAPDFAENIGRLREHWERLGVPALRKLQTFIKESGPEIQGACRLDFEGMKKAGLPAWRVDELRTFVQQASNFMHLALNQLSQIPLKIEKLEPAGERAFIYGNKNSDQIDFELQSVLDAGSDLEERLKRIKTEIARLSAWGTRPRPGHVPVEGGSNVIN